MSTIIIDPITRVSGLLKIEVDIEKNKVIDARACGNQFRGFEKMYKGRPALDIISLAPRLCGICSTHHSLTCVLALEDAMKVKPDFNGMVARDIANGFEFLQNHIRQIYLFAMPDYIDTSDINPLYKTESPKASDYRIPNDKVLKIREHYVEAIKHSRNAHRAIAVLAGKAPHCHGIFIGGITTKIDIPQIEDIKYIIATIKEFIDTKMIADINILAHYYKEYYSIGRGYGNFMDYGLYSKYDSPIKYSSSSVLIDGVKENIDLELIKTDITNSWLESENSELIPGISSPPSANAYKPKGYSWVTAPRYKGYAVEGGPLARMILNGYYTGGVSTMDRLVARVLEARKICESIEGLIEMLKIGEPYQEEWVVPSDAKGIGLTAAARGCLGHWLEIKNGMIENYTIIPPSNWNLCPKDKNGVNGPLEKALIGTEIEDEKNPVEIGRIVRSFDPCLNCAAHITSDKYNPIDITII